MYCIHCGQRMPDDARFCQKCGNGISRDLNETSKQVTESAYSKNILEDDSYYSTISNDNLMLIEIAMGLGIVLFMYILGATSTYPNVYVRMSLQYNTTVLFWYGSLYGFAIRAALTINKRDVKYTLEQGIGGAVLGLIVSLPCYILLSKAEQSGGYVIPIIWILMVSAIIPVAKSIELTIASGVNNGVQVHKLKSNLLIGLISGIVGVILIFVIDAVFRNATLYAAFGVFGFVSYVELLRFNKISKYILRKVGLISYK